MFATFKELQDAVSDELQGDSFYTSSRIKDAINSSYVRFILETRSNNQVDISGTTVVDQEDYTLPTGCLEVFSVKCGSELLTPKSYKELLQYEHGQVAALSGAPRHFTIGRVQGNYSLSPVPDSAGEVLKVWYNKEPTLLSADSDAPIIAVSFREALVQGACERLLRLDKEPGLAKERHKLYMEVVFEFERTQRGKHTVLVRGE